jgi:hypothetical protein
MIKPLPLLLYLMVIMQGFLGFERASIYGAVSAEILQDQNFQLFLPSRG